MNRTSSTGFKGTFPYKFGSAPVSIPLKNIVKKNFKTFTLFYKIK